MHFIVAVVAAVIAAAWFDTVGAMVFAAAIGALTVEVTRLRRRVASLEAPQRAAPGAPAPAADIAATPTLSPGAAKSEIDAAQASVDEAWDPWAPVQRSATPAAATPISAQPRPADTEAASASGESALLRLWQKLSGGNLAVRVGIVVLFFGVAFLLKYVAERSYVPIGLRLSGVALGALALLVVGWRLRRRSAAYGLVLQGGGIGVLYLVVFAALRLYGLLTPGPSFAFLVVICACAVVLAIVQNAHALAMLAFAGGFLAPLLTSSGSGSHVALFAYYAVLNFGIVAISWHKTWRALGVLGFAFTFVIGAAWGYLSYRPEHFASTQPFLILFFGQYLALSILFARQPQFALKGYVDGTLVFGLPVAAFALQARLAADYSYGLAFSALAVGLLYAALALRLVRRGGSLPLLGEAFVALAVAFGTLALPFALDNRFTAGAWALEGAALIWIGLKQQRRLALAAGLLLQLGAGVFVLRQLPGATEPLIVNRWYFGALMLAAAGIFSARRAHRDTRYRQPFELLFLLWAMVWYYGASWFEFARLSAGLATAHTVLAFTAASAVLASAIGRRFDWPLLRQSAFILWPVAGLALVYATRGGHPFAAMGAPSWIGAMLAVYTILWFGEQGARRTPHAAWHVGGFWLVVLTLLWEWHWLWRVELEVAPLWQGAAGLFALAVVLALAARATVASARWPFSSHAGAYTFALGGIVAAAALVSVAANLALPTLPAPLPYVPLINPLDIAQALVLVAAWRWHRLIDDDAARHAFRIAFAAAVFLWLNAVLLRSFHLWVDVPWTLAAMRVSMSVQAALSIFWALIAFAAMVFAVRGAYRSLWLAAAALLGVVVAKLFLVDLASSGTVERIASFIGVGLLLLVVGYFSPVPPRRSELAGETA